MATASVLAPRDVPTTLNYFKPLDDEPPHIDAYAIQDKPKTNIGKEPHPAVVHDARGREAEFSLDKNGFQWVHWPSIEKDFTDDEVIKEKYYPEVERILKEVAGGKRVYIFDHTVRFVRPRAAILGIWIDTFASSGVTVTRRTRMTRRSAAL